MTNIVGIISNQANLSDAIEKLAKLGLAGNIRLFTPEMIDEEPQSPSSHQQVLIARQAGPGGFTKSGLVQAVIPGVVGSVDAEDKPQLDASALRKELEKIGVGQEEARFCVDSLIHGGTLLTLNVDEEYEEDALSVLRGADAIMPVDASSDH
ncbi:MAG: hypothetical protein ACE5JF_12030 [Anaerolineales bacterium]